MTTLSLRQMGLKPAQVRAIERRAKTAGQTLPEYVRSLLEQDLLAGRAFDQILRPVRAGVRKSGVSEADVDAIVGRARAATAAKRGGR
jgi:hypothetical protein